MLILVTEEVSFATITKTSVLVLFKERRIETSSAEDLMLKIRSLRGVEVFNIRVSLKMRRLR